MQAAICVTIVTFVTLVSGVCTFKHIYRPEQSAVFCMRLTNFILRRAVGAVNYQNQNQEKTSCR